ncbi:MAG TPA: hypothetical protein VGR67_15555 [Candidatus Polarisedimenticolia bacterium]|jgi:hypothetical protein|nr:hypothetical protein [Candidatus Polarisedimenticolia bacterium]
MAKAKPGTLKERIDRTRKKLAEGKDKLDKARLRAMTKRLKRAQRARRKLLAAEARAKAKAGQGKEEKKEESAPAPA